MQPQGEARGRLAVAGQVSRSRLRSRSILASRESRRVSAGREERRLTKACTPPRAPPEPRRAAEPLPPHPPPHPCAAQHSTKPASPTPSPSPRVLRPSVARQPRRTDDAHQRALHERRVSRPPPLPLPPPLPPPLYSPPLPPAPRRQPSRLCSAPRLLRPRAMRPSSLTESESTPPE